MKLATICYIYDGSRVLMLYRNKKENDIHEGLWVGVGGRFEPGESPEECVIREVREESGLNVIEPRLRAMLTFAEYASGGDDWYVFLFTADAYGGGLADDCDEGELRWVEKSDLPSLPMHGSDRLFLKWLDEYGFFTAKFFYDEGGALTGHTLNVYYDTY